MIVKITPYALLIAGLCLSNANICMNKRTNKEAFPEQQINEANKQPKLMSSQEELDYFFSETEIDTLFGKYIKKICNEIAQNDRYGRSPIIMAFDNKDFNLVKLLIEHDVVDLNLQNKNGMTPLMYALLFKQLEIAKLLIKKGANLNLQNNDGETALMYAIINNQPEIAKLLIEQGANLNLQDKCGMTALMRSIMYNQPEIAKLLIKKGANLNLQDKHGNTALMYSIWNNKPEIAKLLIEKGANLNLRDNDGKTVLVYILKKLQNIDVNDKNYVTLVALLKTLLFNNATVSEEAPNVMLDKNRFDYSFFAAIVSLQKSINNGNKNSLREAIKDCPNNPKFNLFSNGNWQRVTTISLSDLVTLALCKHQPCKNHGTTCPSHCQNSREHGGKQIQHCIEKNSLTIQDLLDPIKTCNSLSLITLKQIVSCINHQGRETLKSAVEKRRNNQISIEVIERHEMVTNTDGSDLRLNYL